MHRIATGDGGRGTIMQMAELSAIYSGTQEIYLGQYGRVPRSLNFCTEVLGWQTFPCPAPTSVSASPGARSCLGRERPYGSAAFPGLPRTVLSYPFYVVIVARTAVQHPRQVADDALAFEISLAVLRGSLCGARPFAFLRTELEPVWTLPTDSLPSRFTQGAESLPDVTIEHGMRSTSTSVDFADRHVDSADRRQLKSIT